jgi:hypothetical protein
MAVTRYRGVIKKVMVKKDDISRPIHHRTVEADPPILVISRLLDDAVEDDIPSGYSLKIWLQDRLTKRRLLGQSQSHQYATMKHSRMRKTKT